MLAVPLPVPLALGVGRVGWVLHGTLLGLPGVLAAAGAAALIAVSWRRLRRAAAHGAPGRGRLTH